MIITINSVARDTPVPAPAPIPNPQPGFGAYEATIPIFTPVAGKNSVRSPTQIVGLVPLICTDINPTSTAFSKCDCREWTNDDCYINPVFASSTDTDVLKNDKNSFLLEFPFLYQYQWTDNSLASFSLNRYNGTNWIGLVNLTNNTYGTYYNFGSLCIKNWKGFEIDWRKILLQYGEGFYRFRVDYNIFGSSGSLVSEPFCLKEWSCAGVDVTVRWETTITGGRIGSITDDQRVFDFCCVQPIEKTPTPLSVTWSDQIRVYGFFGKEKTEYERVNIEYQNGEVIQVRNEAIQKFEYESALQPKWIHDRLKDYGFMADQIYVSDFNWNNSDYEIDRKRVVCDGSYEPEYNINTRYSNVKVLFKEGFQNVIRDKCCSTAVRKLQN